MNGSNDYDFRDLVAESVRRGRCQELAKEFETSEITVKRWATGVSDPHPKMKQLVIDYLTEAEGI